MKKAHFAALLLAVLLGAFSLAAQSPREEFKEMVASTPAESRRRRLCARIVIQAATARLIPLLPFPKMPAAT